MFSRLQKGLLCSAFLITSLQASESKSILQQHMQKRASRQGIINQVKRKSNVSVTDKRAVDSWGAAGGWNYYELSALLFPTDFIYDMYADDDYFFEKFSPAPYADRVNDILPDGWSKSLKGKAFIADYISYPVFDSNDELESYEELISDSMKVTDSTISSLRVSSLSSVMPELGFNQFTASGAPKAILLDDGSDTLHDLLFEYEGDNLTSFSYHLDGDNGPEVESYMVSYITNKTAASIQSVELYNDGADEVVDLIDSTTFEYSGGKVGKEFYFTFNGTSFEKNLTTHYSYNSDDNVTSIHSVDADGAVVDSVSFTYDGEKITEVLSYANGEMSEYYKCSYNSDGLLDLECSYDWVDNAWEIWDSTYYTYDDDNNLTVLGYDGMYECSFSYENGYPSTAIEFYDGVLIGIYALTVKDTEAILKSNKLNPNQFSFRQQGKSLVYEGSVAREMKKVSLYNSLGKMVYEFVPQKSSAVVSLDLAKLNLAQGVYLTQVQLQNRVVSHKIRM